jgi:hypothetical protein
MSTLQRFVVLCIAGWMSFAWAAGPATVGSSASRPAAASITPLEPAKPSAIAGPDRAVSSPAGSAGADKRSDSTLDAMAKWGQLIGGISALVAVCIAGLTLLMVHLRQQRTAWFDSFRALYAEFWHDDDIAEIRRCIVNEQSYAAMVKVLDRRNGSDGNALDRYDNALLEKIDRFCALMVRVNSLGEARAGKKERDLWYQLYGRFWFGKLQVRSELWAYLEKHWHALDESVRRIRSRYRVPPPPPQGERRPAARSASANSALPRNDSTAPRIESSTTAAT